MAYGWEGGQVRLVPLDAEKHLENAVRWLNDPVITENLLVGHLPLTKIFERDYFERMSRMDGKDAAFAIELLNGEHVGFSGVHAINWRDRTATTGTFIGVLNHWGKGLGSDAARVRSEYAFEVLGLRYLMSAVLEGNERSLGMLKKVGYEECGRYPKRIWQRGRFVDDILLYMTREMWQARKAAISGQ
jgi:RimJ/RimL family protein N-acetyltransferase